MTKFEVKFALGDRVRYTPRYRNPYPDLLDKEGEIVSVDIYGAAVDYLVKFDVPKTPFYMCSQEELELAIIRNSDDLYKVWRCNGEI